MSNPRSAYVRRKQAHKPCDGCGSLNIWRGHLEEGLIWICRDCNRFKMHDEPSMMSYRERIEYWT